MSLKRCIGVFALCVGINSQGEKVHLVLLLIMDESGYGEHLQCVSKLEFCIVSNSLSYFLFFSSMRLYPMHQ